jgi:hypothetical protein
MTFDLPSWSPWLLAGGRWPIDADEVLPTRGDRDAP